jgi:hypothetical protein
MELQTNNNSNPRYAVRKRNPNIYTKHWRLSTLFAGSLLHDMCRGDGRPITKLLVPACIEKN